MQASQAMVAHACNPSYLGGRDQEDFSSRPTLANSSQDPISKNPQVDASVLYISLASNGCHGSDFPLCVRALSDSLELISNTVKI
jgi:hypothetical protein